MVVVAPPAVLDVPAGPEVEVVELPEPVPGAVVVEPVLVLAPVLVVGAVLVVEPVVVVKALVGAELAGGVVNVAGDAVVSGLGSSRVAAVAVVVTMTTGIGVASDTVAGASSGRTRL